MINQTQLKNAAYLLRIKAAIVCAVRESHASHRSALGIGHATVENRKGRFSLRCVWRRGGRGLEIFDRQDNDVTDTVLQALRAYHIGLTGRFHTGGYVSEQLHVVGGNLTILETGEEVYQHKRGYVKEPIRIEMTNVGFDHTEESIRNLANAFRKIGLAYKRACPFVLYETPCKPAPLFAPLGQAVESFPYGEEAYTGEVV